MQGKASEKEIADFLNTNRDVLRSSQFSAGGWFARSSGRTYLDISVVVRSRELAITLGRANNQKAIMQLRTLQEIDIRGGGKKQVMIPMASDVTAHVTSEVTNDRTNKMASERIQRLEPQVQLRDWRATIAAFSPGMALHPKAVNLVHGSPRLDCPTPALAAAPA